MTGTQVALVTGANRGIGLEICRQLAQQGIHVILGDKCFWTPAALKERASWLMPCVLAGYRQT